MTDRTAPRSKDRRRVCFVLPSLAGGGAERAAVQVLNGLDERRWDRTMYLLAREGPYLSDVAPAVVLAAGDATSRVGRWVQLCRYFRATRPDVVVAFLSYFTALSAARAARIGTKVVFNLQTPMSAFLADGDYHWRRPGSRAGFAAVTRVGCRAADLVVVTSRGVAADLTARFGVADARTRVLPNPVDIGRIRAAMGEALDPDHQARWDAPVIVATGRLAEAKNYPLLIEALALLRARVPARVFILGQGELEPDLRRLTAARGLDESVTFCGFQANPWKYIARADVFVMTSRYEGFGNVLVEAFACGVPVVATSSPGSCDVVTHEVDGLLVERHEPEAVASALERLVGDRTTRDRMAAAARGSAERFALPAVARAYDDALGALWR